jgi:hypothetical protein
MVPDSSHQLSPIEEYRILLSEEVVQYIFLKENTILSNFRNVVFIFICFVWICPTDFQAQPALQVLNHVI